MKKIIIGTIVSILIFSCQSRKKIEKDVVVVIGGGLMGSSVAWELSKSGKSVLLIVKFHKVVLFFCQLALLNSFQI